MLCSDACRRKPTLQARCRLRSRGSAGCCRNSKKGNVATATVILHVSPEFLGIHFALPTNHLKIDIVTMLDAIKLSVGKRLRDEKILYVKKTTMADILIIGLTVFTAIIEQRSIPIK